MHIAKQVTWGQTLGNHDGSPYHTFFEKQYDQNTGLYTSCLPTYNTIYVQLNMYATRDVVYI